MDGHSARNFEELFAMPQPNMTEVVSSSGAVVVTGRPLPVTPAMRETLEFIQSTTPITTSNIISMSIINRQSLIGKVYSRYLHSPGSHQSTRFLESVSDSLSH